MEVNTLQSVLRSKYNIDEKLQAEVIFVGLVGSTMEAKGLFSFGIGERFVVVAGMNLRGPHIDYNPVSFTPVSLLDVTYKHASRIVTISSQFKGKQAYQLCSSAKAAAVWDDFTTAMDRLRSKPDSYIWCSASLTTSSSAGASVNETHLNYRCFPGQMFSKAVESYSSTSLFDAESGPTEALFDAESGPTEAKYAVWNQHVKRGHSLDCVNVSFDNFVNDHDSNLNAIAQQVSWTAQATPPGETDDRLEESTSKPQTLIERFLRFLSCCRTKH